MANLGKKGDIFVIRFRFGGKEFKKSLKIRARDEAEAARSLVELTIHRLRTGQLHVPDGVDVGDFVVSGGTLQPPPPGRRRTRPSRPRPRPHAGWPRSTPPASRTCWPRPTFTARRCT